MVHMHTYVLRGWCAAQIVRASARGGGGGILVSSCRAPSVAGTLSCALLYILCRVGVHHAFSRPYVSTFIRDHFLIFFLFGRLHIFSHPTAVATSIDETESDWGSPRSSRTMQKWPDRQHSYGR